MEYCQKAATQHVKFLPGVLWAYRNIPHNSTEENLSFLLFSINYRLPIEAAYLKSTDIYPVDIDDYQKEQQVSVISAQKIAAAIIQKAQMKQKSVHDKHHLK